MHSIQSIIIIVIGVAMLCLSCTGSVNHECVVLIDQTDKAISKPTAKTITDKLSVRDTWDGMAIRKVTISNVEYGREENLVIEAKESLFANEYTRLKEHKFFAKQLDSMFIDADGREYKHSIIYPVIVREANTLAGKSNSEKKVMMIFSDLMEHTDVFSFSKMRFASSINSIEKAWSRLESTYSTTLNDDLSSIEVHVIYTANDFSRSRQFSKVAEMYKREFEKRGAKVTISGTI